MSSTEQIPGQHEKRVKTPKPLTPSQQRMHTFIQWARDTLSLRPDWYTDELACAGKERDLFFVRGAAANSQRAKQICRTCPRILECLADAIIQDENQGAHGVFGGLTYLERRAVTREVQRHGIQAAGVKMAHLLQFDRAPVALVAVNQET